MMQNNELASSQSLAQNTGLHPNTDSSLPGANVTAVSCSSPLKALCLWLLLTAAADVNDVAGCS